MRGFKAELAVGIFVIAVFAVLAYMTFRVAGFEFGEKKGYIVYAHFKNIAGLDEKSKIKMAGVDAGTIEKIELSDGLAKLTLRIYPSVRLYSDAKASIRASGLLGDKFLFLTPGEKEPLLKNGDTIKNISEITDIDDIFRNFSDVSKSINELASTLTNAVNDEEVKNSLRQTVFNLRDLTNELKGTISENREKLTSILDKVDRLVASLERMASTNEMAINNTVSNLSAFSNSLKTDGPELMRNLSKSMEELRSTLQESRPHLTSIANKADATMSALSNITSDIEKGKGTIGKLLKDEKLYASVTNAVEGVDKALSSITRFRTFLTFQGDYLIDESNAKGSFLVTLQPRPEKYYIIGVTSDPVGSVEVTETTTNGTTIKEKKIETKLEFTAQFARRFGNSALRIGLTESTFGLGADYFMYKDKLKFILDAWDFGKDEVDAKAPHVKIGAEYLFFKSLFISAGIDNLFNRKHSSVYVGGGVRFEDEDFKYIFGTMPKIPGQ